MTSIMQRTQTQTREEPESFNTDPARLCILHFYVPKLSQTAFLYEK